LKLKIMDKKEHKRKKTKRREGKGKEENRSEKR
jgi:hypothetical protein